MKPENTLAQREAEGGQSHRARARGIRAGLEAALQRYWSGDPAIPAIPALPDPDLKRATRTKDRGLLMRMVHPALLALSWIVSTVAQRKRHRIALAKAKGKAHPKARVVVIGNLIVGGTGKTPLVLATADELSRRGWKVGLIARGHGSRTMAESAQRLPSPIPSGAAATYGDEPVLLAQASGLPVAAGHDRGAALKALLDGADCDVVLSDDGLQHEGLDRDIEIAVFDGRGAGNGRVLPAGPLREPLFNALLLDAVLLNGRQVPSPLTHSRVFRFTVEAQACHRLDGKEQLPLSEAARSWKGERIHALAAIGQPQRFFDDLLSAGLKPSCWALADHAPPDPSWVEGLAAERILMTSKDAVKCGSWPAALLARCYEVTSRATIDPDFIDWLEERLRGSQMD
ncbi:MAG: tetraacyldisaccharide 4'-kinase [Burkholderiaceae bacterium]